MRFVYISLIAFFCSCGMVFSQQISVDNSVNLQQLIEDNLVNGCVEISNITSTVNGNSIGIPSYGYFERGSSNFPFESGIMLSTGAANSAGNTPITPPLSEGSTSWGTDPDIEAALGFGNTFNATSIEFDFESVSGQLQFNYLMASEEYIGTNSCSSGDSFVFLIREAGSTGPYQNIALIPGTSSSVTISNIHLPFAGNCTAQNEQFFEGFDFGDTNFQGRTTVLSASTTITPYTTYHIKLIIADQRDRLFDSAVFIEGSSFEVLDLGPDIVTCASEAVLDADINNNSATYAWYLNGSATPIPGATNSTYTATQDGTYRVVVTVPLNGSPCEDEDTINVTLNTDELYTEDIDNFILCDAGGDNQELFDLLTKNTEISNGSPFTNPGAITYHLDNASATDSSNPGITSFTKTDTSNPTPIFVRVEDADSDCKSITSFDLILNPLPIPLQPAPLEVCDEDGNTDGLTVIDLTQKDEEISGDPSYTVTYHLTNANGSPPIADPTRHFNALENEIIFARVTDQTTGCVSLNAVPLAITVNRPPEVVPDLPTQYIGFCDQDYDGFEEFDLTEVELPIVGSLTNYIPTYYEDEQDARAGNDNFIPDPENYVNTNTETTEDDLELGVQTLYIRIEDIDTGCATVVDFQIHTNIVLTGTQLGAFALCDDDTDEENTRDFPLQTITNYINGGLLNPSGDPANNIVSVTYFDADGNEILGPNYPVSQFETLSVILDDGNGCIEPAEIDLWVNPQIIFAPIDPISYCDTDGDGFTEINLSELDLIVTNGDDSFNVTYFSDPDAADINDPTFQLTAFVNTTPVTTVYARIESNLRGIICHTVNEFEVEVIPAPITNALEDIRRCLPNDTDIIDLIADQPIDVVNDPTGLIIEYFRTEEAANNWDPNNPTSDWIPNAERNNFTAPLGGTEIFVRVENPNLGIDCNPYAIESFTIHVNTEPVIDEDARISFCKDPSTPGDPVVSLSDYDDYILDGQTDKIVEYFDIVTGDPLPDTITGFNGSITVVISNITDPDCRAERVIPVTIALDPEFDPITPLLECIEPGSSAPYTYNLERKRQEIQATSSEVLNITFHREETNADNNIDDLDSQITYIHPNETTSVYARIESDLSGCAVTRRVDIIAVVQPSAINIQPYTICDSDSAPYDQETTFNLNTIFDITNNDNPNNLFTIEGDRITESEYEIHYFRTVDDIDFDNITDNSQAISGTELQAFTSSTATIQVKIVNTLSNCYTVFPFQLIVDTPPSFNALTSVPECYDISNQYNLSQLDALLVDDTSIVNINYTDDQGGIYNNKLFDYTTPGNYTIYVQIADATTLCDIQTSFTLTIHANPVANPVPDLYYCDSNNIEDDRLEFNLLDNESLIRGSSQPESLFALTFYNDFDNASQGISSIGNTYESLNEEIIYARLENRATNCFDITQFQTRINPIPIIPINQIVPLCNDEDITVSADTGVVGDRYEWSTGETGPDIIVRPSDLTNGLLELSVTVTRPYVSGDCPTAPYHFTVVASDEAEIVFTPTVDFADPNRIIVEIDPTRQGDYIYLLDGVENSPEATSNVFDNVSYGSHIVTVRDINGCNDVSKNVFVFDIPKFFTPNDDPYNNTWHIIGIERPELTGTIVYVYNRYGKLLKTLPHTSIGWDGTFNGYPMPADDYWFVAKVVQLGETFDIRGHFALKR